MTPPPDNTPWWAWLLAVVLVAVVAQIPVLVQLVRTRKAVSAVQDQVQNSHETNLRVDIDAVKATAAAAESHAAGANTEATLAKESSHRTERLAEDLVKSLRAIEHSMDRREKLAAEFQEESREDRAGIRRDLETFAKESRADRETLHGELQQIHQIVDPLA